MAQAFLGIRMQCAQCHNHPFDRWTQDDYYGWAAFFSQIGRKRGADPRETIVFDRRGGEVKHPVTKKNVPPRFLGGARPKTRGKDRRAVAADPDNGAYIDSLGWVFYQMGRYQEALVQLQRAARLVPDDGTIQEHLGDVYLSLGRRLEAAEAYRRALTLKDTDLEQVRDKLKPLADGATDAP